MISPGQLMHASRAQPNLQPGLIADTVINVSPARVAQLDAGLRDRLDWSIDHVSEVFRANQGRDLNGVRELKARLRAGPVSPWVFGLYSKLVAELSRHEADKAELTFHDVVKAASLPPTQGMIELGDETIAASWWDHYCLLLDTDRKRTFSFRPPKPQDAELCRQETEETLDLIKQADPELHDELGALLRMIVLGGSESSSGFDGASTFFFWGAALVNAEARRDLISAVDRLIHEGSHVLLFGLSAAGPLTKNDGSERYASALRADARPVEGIFHACFVTTRVHMAMSRLLGSGVLGSAEKDSAVSHRDYNGRAARASLDTLAQYATMTELGKNVYGALRQYWSVN